MSKLSHSSYEDELKCCLHCQVMKLIKIFGVEIFGPPEIKLLLLIMQGYICLKVAPFISPTLLASLTGDYVNNFAFVSSHLFFLFLHLLLFD